MKTAIIALAILLTGCATTTLPPETSLSRNSNTYVYDKQGSRLARIDSQGNIYSTQGKTSGQRIGRVK